MILGAHSFASALARGTCELAAKPSLQAQVAAHAFKRFPDAAKPVVSQSSYPSKATKTSHPGVVTMAFIGGSACSQQEISSDTILA